MLKIATFNLFNYIEPPYACYDFDRIYSQTQWHKKQRWLIAYLSQYQPDIIGFQEVFSPDSLQTLVEQAGYPHFTVVDAPKLMTSDTEIANDYIYQSPVVAIASRYPIIECTGVAANTDMAVDIGLSDEYAFSRTPLRATIELPHIGNTDCYVVHFKSKRPQLTTDDPDLETTKAVLAEFKRQICGSWGSAVQRGSESALLFEAMVSRRQISGNPMLLMGDFNDAIGNSTLENLLMRELRFVKDVQAQQIVKQFSLQDSWDLHTRSHDKMTSMNKTNVSDTINITNTNSTSTSGNSANQLHIGSRPPTHYFGSKGSVLDYILLSCEFDAQYSQSSYAITDYHTYDRHLVNPKYDRDSESTDHAVVQIQLSPRI